MDGICVTAGYGFEHDPSNTALALTVAQSRIHDCGDDPHEHGLYLESTRGAAIRDNYLYRNPGYGISMYPDAQRSTIEHNVLDSNSLAGRANITFSGEAAGGEYSKPHGSDGNVVRFNIISNPAQRYNVDSYYPAGSVLRRTTASSTTACGMGPTATSEGEIVTRERTTGKSTRCTRTRRRSTTGSGRTAPALVGVRASARNTRGALSRRRLIRSRR